MLWVVSKACSLDCMQLSNLNFVVLLGLQGILKNCIETESACQTGLNLELLISKQGRNPGVTKPML